MSNNKKTAKPFDRYGNQEKYVFFWKDKSIYSNWHHSPYQLDGHNFQNSEQGMMYGKAILFGDTVTAQHILETDSPSGAKGLGRVVENFSEDVWRDNREEIMYKHLLAKFTQNPTLKQTLLETGDRLLAEASPSDAIWGIGMKEHEAIETHPSKWKGLNLLGKALVRVRETIVRDGL